MTLTNIIYRFGAEVSSFPLALLQRMTGDNLESVVYHTVSNRQLPHVKHLYRYKTVDQFVADLKFMTKHYEPIGLADVLERQRTGARLPMRPLLLTFDDGLREIADVVAPILQEMRVPATFFLATAFLNNLELFYKHKASILVDQLRRRGKRSHLKALGQMFGMSRVSVRAIETRLLSTGYGERHLLDESAECLQVDFARYLREVRPYVTTEEVNRLMRQGFTIGAHSRDHPVFASLTLSEQLRQVDLSMQFLAERFALDYRAFAFPFNDRGVSSNFFEEAAKQAGVELFFGTSSMMEDSEQRSYQRTLMETLPVPASTMLVARYLRMLSRKWVGRNRVEREGYVEGAQGAVRPVR